MRRRGSSLGRGLKFGIGMSAGRAVVNGVTNRRKWPWTKRSAKDSRSY